MPLKIMLDKNPDIIEFLFFEIAVKDFLWAMGGIALITFFILLSILLIMYLNKRFKIKGYLSLEEKDYQLEDKILQIEHEISKIQRKFYSSKFGTRKKSILNR